MKFNLTIAMDNAAFDDEGGAPAEVVNILTDLIERIEGYGRFHDGDREKLHDINGNTVGEWAVVEED